MNRTAYLAGPIDQDPAHGQLALKDDIAATLRSANFAVFRPERAWTAEGVEPHPRLQQINHEVVEWCGLFVAVLPAGVPTIGTVTEITRAIARGKKVAVFSDITHSWALSEILEKSPVDKLRTYPLEMTPDIADDLARFAHSDPPGVRIEVSSGGGGGGKMLPNYTLPNFFGGDE